MRFPLVVGVVLIHNFGTPQAIPLAEGGAGLPVDMLCCNLVRWSLSDVLGRLAVPLFFLFSGYLFFATAQPWSPGVYVDKLRRRIHTLLLPYMGWNILQVVAILALALLAWWVKGEPVAAKWPAHTPMEWLRLFWASAPYDLNHVNWLGHPYTMCAPVFGPMWFVRDLMVMCLLAPVVRLWVRYARRAGVLLLALCYVSEVWPLVYGLSVTAVFFFTWGAYLAINGCNLVALARRYRVPCAVATLLLFPPYGVVRRSVYPYRASPAPVLCAHGRPYPDSPECRGGAQGMVPGVHAPVGCQLLCVRCPPAAGERGLPLPL